jgi:hypothetical protein
MEARVDADWLSLEIAAPVVQYLELGSPKWGWHMGAVPDSQERSRPWLSRDVTRLHGLTSELVCLLSGRGDDLLALLLRHQLPSGRTPSISFDALKGIQNM